MEAAVQSFICPSLTVDANPLPHRTFNTISALRHFTKSYQPCFYFRPRSTVGLPLLRILGKKPMRCRERVKKPGAILPVTDSYHYPLPPGLKAGTLVKLIHFDCGYWIVEANGEQFTVFQTRIDAGFEYECNGRWLAVSDPRIVQPSQQANR